MNKIIGEGFHLLSFDPRGVNGSIPRATCYETSARRAQDVYNIPWDAEFQAGEMFTGAENRGRACADTMGEHGAYINTPQTAADMNSILDAIGQEKMYYWGFSCESIFVINPLTVLPANPVKTEQPWDRLTLSFSLSESPG